MDLSKLHKDSELLKIYELFGEEKRDGTYLAMHTLNRLYLDLGDKKDSKEIKKIVNPFLSDYAIPPYLMLENLTDGEEIKLIKLITNDITKNLFPEKNFSENIIRRVKYPSLDLPFMKNLLNTMTRERRQPEKFNDPKKARELFLYYAEKQHMNMALDELESYARSYHIANDDGGGLDCGED